ncbi:hypothetical protein ASD06_00785 [Angustibacter sp. Root456]|nr:hypothetical protein ASD06_00785 [Angustibacter sp. Root456]
MAARREAFGMAAFRAAISFFVGVRLSISADGSRMSPFLPFAVPALVAAGTELAAEALTAVTPLRARARALKPAAAAQVEREPILRDM